MNSDSNIDEVEAKISDVWESFGFSIPGIGGGTLGQDCAGTVADAIATDAAQSKGAEGQTFPENSPKYKAWKARRYGQDAPGYRTGQMLSLESLKGEVQIEGDEVVMTYGTDEPPTRSSTGMGFNPDTDGAITDREKMGYITEKFGPIFAMNADRQTEVTEVIGDAFSRHIRSKLSGGP